MNKNKSRRVPLPRWLAGQARGVGGGAVDSGERSSGVGAHPASTLRVWWGEVFMAARAPLRARTTSRRETSRRTLRVNAWRGGHSQPRAWATASTRRCAAAASGASSRSQSVRHSVQSVSAAVPVHSARGRPRPGASRSVRSLSPRPAPRARRRQVATADLDAPHSSAAIPSASARTIPSAAKASERSTARSRLTARSFWASVAAFQAVSRSLQGSFSGVSRAMKEGCWAVSRAWGFIRPPRK